MKLLKVLGQLLLVAAALRGIADAGRQRRAVREGAVSGKPQRKGFLLVLRALFRGDTGLGAGLAPAFACCLALKQECVSCRGKQPCGDLQ